MDRTDRHEQIIELKSQMDTFFRNVESLLNRLEDPAYLHRILTSIQATDTLKFTLNALHATRTLAQAQYDELIALLEEDGLSPIDHANTEGRDDL